LQTWPWSITVDATTAPAPKNFPLAACGANSSRLLAMLTPKFPDADGAQRCACLLRPDGLATLSPLPGD